MAIIKNRSVIKREVLNSIRLTILDWDPLDLFKHGMASLEEYDKFIPNMAEIVKKSKTFEDFQNDLRQFCLSVMEVESLNELLFQSASKKLFSLNLK